MQSQGISQKKKKEKKIKKRKEINKCIFQLQNKIFFIFLSL
jgi:hypothetical protein